LVSQLVKREAPGSHARLIGKIQGMSDSDPLRLETLIRDLLDKRAARS